MKKENSYSQQLQHKSQQREDGGREGDKEATYNRTRATKDLEQLPPSSSSLKPMQIETTHTHKGEL